MKQGCQGPSLALLSALSFLACWILGLPPCLLPHGSKRAAAVSDSSTVTEEPRGGQEAKALSSSDLKVSPLRRGEPLGGILTLTCRNWFTRQLGLRPVTGRRERDCWGRFTPVEVHPLGLSSWDKGCRPH